MDFSCIIIRYFDWFKKNTKFKLTECLMNHHVFWKYPFLSHNIIINCKNTKKIALN